MLFLLFELDGERYALDAREIARVLPLRPARAFPGTPRWVAGVIEHDRMPVPVIDLAQRALGRPAHARLSTRLVLVHYRPAGPAGDGAPARLLALLLERATRTRRYDAAQFADGGVATPQARWLGPVARDADGFVQWVKVDQLLDDEARAQLFPDPPSWQAQGGGA